jgi:hypothetical protein
MAVRTFDLAFSDWMMRLFIGLSLDILMATKTEIRLCDLQHILLRPSRMD